MNKAFDKCRLCLKLGDFCSIFDTDETIKLSEMVMSFAHVQIFEGDGLPNRVCSACIENISTAYLFKQQCERIDSMLRQSFDQPSELYTTAEADSILDKSFHLHHIKTVQENDFNSNKDPNTNNLEHRIYDVHDETDSDVDSIKCVYCSQAYNNLGVHHCHVKCTIEKEQHQTSSNETLVASDYNTCLESPLNKELPPEPVEVSCVLCDEKFQHYKAYESHVNICTSNVRLHHYVCPICHEIFSEKMVYLTHLKDLHFKDIQATFMTGEDCVDTFVPSRKVSRPVSVKRQIGWSVEDIYQEIDCKPNNDSMNTYMTPTSSPFKSFFSRLSNDSFSKQSTPKKGSFRKLVEEKTKGTTYFPFRRYLSSFRKKAENYSPLKGKLQAKSVIHATIPEIVSDSEYGSPSGTSEESWKLKQNLICACDKKVFMLSEFLHDRDRIVSMINELGGVVAENTKMEMLATHFVAVLPNDTFTGMMVCALATGKWLLHVNFVYDCFRNRKFLQENYYEWKKHPKLLEVDNTSVEVAKAAVYWHLELQALNAKMPFEGKQIVLIMKKKYRQYYHMIFKALKAKPITYDPRTPGSCCSADYCFVDMKVIERIKLKFFARHNVPVFPYQYILIYLLNKGKVENESKYLLQDCNKVSYHENFDNTY